MHRSGMLALVIILICLMQGTAFSKDFDSLDSGSSPLNVSLSMSKVPSTDEAATVTCNISSYVDVTDAIANIILPPGAKLVEGNLSWRGNLSANAPVEFDALIQFEDAGAFLIEASAWKIIDPENQIYWEAKDVIYLTVRGELDKASEETKKNLKETAYVKKLEWIGPGEPDTYEDYLKSEKYNTALTPGDITPITDAPPDVRKPPNYIILVRSGTLLGSLSTEINRYEADVDDQGYEASVYYYVDGANPSPADIRNWLAGWNGLVGVLLVGDFPTAWFEATCWGEHEEWPLDLYYMDLDGTWTDSDADGVFDSHTGDRDPEIFVARLKANNLLLGGVGEVKLIRNYLDKNHRYRQGLLTTTKRGLTYIDDDWVGSATAWDTAHKMVYDPTTLVTDKATTVPTDYMNKLGQGYDSVLIACHGSSGGQTFKIPPDVWDGSMDSSTIKALDPPAFFYNLFICSSTRFTQNDYYGGWHIFTNFRGLVAVGSTKTGSMLEFDDFYRPIAQGETIGSAFIEWFKENGVDDVCWHYGMNILGDPMLTPLKYGSPIKIALRAYNGQYLCAEGGGGGAVVANRDTIGAWETFQLVPLGDGNVALRASNGQYLCAEGGGGGFIVANRNAIGAWETFVLMDLGNNKIGLKANNGMRVVAENGGGDGVYANRAWVGDWETFGLIEISS